MKVDIAAFGPHPDDVELFAGGTLHKMKMLGHTTAIVDLTQGELGTHGTIVTRQKESRAAAKILGVETRENLGMPDGNIETSHENRLKIIGALRKYRPTIVLAPHPVGRHPDHMRASELIRDASFLAGLRKIDTGQERFMTRQVLYYFEHAVTGMPDIVVDITESFNEKMKAVRTYKSQFYNPKQRGPQPYLSRKEYLEELEARARFYGSLIGVKYGEAFSVRAPVPVTDPVSVWSE
jgi:bacillithiol biosynthesis deacetylase BshB1